MPALARFQLKGVILRINPQYYSGWRPGLLFVQFPEPARLPAAPFFNSLNFPQASNAMRLGPVCASLGFARLPSGRAEPASLTWPGKSFKIGP
jgi:hypothetical protein